MTKILVVDDQEEVRTLLATTLVRARYQILTVGEGSLALAVAREQKPDLIIMDVMMPGRINGLEATRILKSDPETSGCPIIILSGKDRVDDLRKGIEAGANSYFIKPFSPRQLIQRIEELLVGSQSRCTT